MSVKQEVDARVFDTLRWVAQEARGLVMASATDPSKDAKLREALAALKKAYEESK